MESWVTVDSDSIINGQYSNGARIHLVSKKIKCQSIKRSSKVIGTEKY